MSSEKFTSAFNQIESYLRKLLGADKHITFSELVKRAAEKNSTIRHFKDDLLQYGDLRNAIVHTRKGDFTIAEPHVSTVTHIEKIYEQLTKPKTVASYFIRSVFSVNGSESIGDVVRQMTKNDYSQAPVIKEGRIAAMLNAQAIAFWLGGKIEVDLISLNKSIIDEVLECSDTENNFRLISRKETLIGVRDIFIDSIGKDTPLEALIITENGKSTEKPIGIITRSEDLATVIREVNS